MIQLSVSGTVEEIIEFAKRLEKSLEHSEELTSEEEVAVRSGRIIDAIKAYRSRTGVGLAEAKSFIETTPAWFSWKAWGAVK